MINIIRIVVLFDNAFIHYDDAVRHGQCFFLIVCYIDEGQAQTALKVFLIPAADFCAAGNRARPKARPVRGPWDC